MEIRLLTIKEVCFITSLSKSTIQRMVREDKFPKPKKLNRSVRWINHDIYKWIDNLETYLDDNIQAKKIDKQFNDLLST